MSEVGKPSRPQSFIKEYKPVGRLLHTKSSTSKMSWSGSVLPPPPPGVHLPPAMLAARGKPRAEEPPDPHHPRPPEDFPVKLSLKLEPEEKDTDLARICSDSLHELPQLVKVGERFEVQGNDVKLEKGESLLLLFIAELPRVHAVDMSNKSEMWLPVYAEQIYERLPLDPRLDDKLYMGATALMNAKPMPSVVRVVEGYGSDDYTECVDQEDIIEISHIEEKSRRHGKEKVLIAKNQIGHRLELHRDMECAHFTTMMSALFLHMSQLIDLDFPQRVRVVEETTFEKRKPKEEKVLKLLSYKKDLQVIATRTKKPALLSIPITIPLSVSVASFKEKTVQACLPALFPPVNLTWGLKEVGRPELPDPQREISQPLPEPVRVWINSFEGKERACKVADVSKTDLIRELKELTNYNKDLSDRVAFLGQAGRPEIPDRETARAPKAPPRPPKPTTLRKLPKPPPDEKPTEDKPKLTPKPKPRSVSTSDDKKTPKYEVAHRSTSADDGYEVPEVLEFSDEEGDDYEEVPDVGKIKDAGNKTLGETCKELKRILQQKEKIITKLREQKEDLERKCKKLEKEKEIIRQENIKHADEIIRLQTEIDRLMSKDDDDIYDIINPTERPLPVLPTSAGAVIYSTPDSLLVERACLSRTDAEGVADLLRQLGLSRYVEKFQQEEIDGALLTTLDETVLKEDLGMTGLHARKLLLEVKKQSK